MSEKDDLAKAEIFLRTFCNVKPNRRTGSKGNREAADFFASTIQSYGYQMDTTEFESLDYSYGEVTLEHHNRSFEVFISPYSLGYDALAELVCVSTIQELETKDFRDKLLLLSGDICAEQLMPKNFTFYNPDEHQKIIAILENNSPVGIITATGKNPELVGALSPFPLINDGDFDIPSVYCKKSVGETLADLEGQTLHLLIDSVRIPTTSHNVVAKLGREGNQKILFTAHLDAYEDSPGALDNAAGITVLLLLAEKLANYQGEHSIEFVAINGEDHYSAGGEKDYIRRYQSEFPDIKLAVNIDDIGFKMGNSAYSFYGCDQALEAVVDETMRNFNGITRGEQWFNGDHMIFLQSGVPSIALTSALITDVMREFTHTAKDTPENIDFHKLVEVATALKLLVQNL